jgi:hypothetical protein
MVTRWMKGRMRIRMRRTRRRLPPNHHLNERLSSCVDEEVSEGVKLEEQEQQHSFLYQLPSLHRQIHWSLLHLACRH